MKNYKLDLDKKWLSVAVVDSTPEMTKVIVTSEEFFIFELDISETDEIASGYEMVVEYEPIGNFILLAPIEMVGDFFVVVAYPALDSS